MGIAERKERQRAELRDQILTAAREILLRDGFEGLTMRKIAEAIEYSPATIYLYFENRDEIARQLCLRGMRDLLAALEPAAGIADPLERLAAIAKGYVDFGVRHSETYRLIFMADSDLTKAVFSGQPFAQQDDTGAQALELLVGTLAELTAQGRLAADADAARLADVLWAAVHGIVSLKLTCPAFPATPVESLVDTMVHTLFYGMTKRSERD